MKNLNLLLRICLISLLILASVTLRAQINVTLKVLPPYQSRISDYASRPDLMVLTLSNTSTVTRQIQLSGTITGNNGVAAWLKPGYKSPQPIEMAPGQMILLNGNDIAQLFDYNQIEYTGVSVADFTRGVGLPEGNYQICIRALDYNTRQPISPDQPIGCSNLVISNVEPPRILSPFNDQEIKFNAAQSFPITWSSSPGGPVLPTYYVKMVEILGNLNPNDAMRSSFSPPFFEKEVNTNTLLYGPADPQLTPGRKYALMVKAIDPSGRINYRNGGQSEVIQFTYQKEGISLPENMMVKAASAPFAANVPNCANCNTAKPGGNAANDLILQDAPNRIIKVNQFEMKVLTVNASNGKLSGTGTITLPVIGNISSAIKLRVAFSELSINSKFEMLEGNVHGIKRADFSFLPNADQPELNSSPLTSNEINQLDQYFKNNTNQLVSKLTQSAASAGAELPLGLDKGAFTIGITNVFFTATQSWFEAISVMNMPDANMKIAFSGKGICISPTSLCGEASLYLSEDALLASTGLKLLGGNEGTQLIFDSKGFKLLKIAANYQFPQGTPLLDAVSNQPISLTIKAKTEVGWADWIAEVSVSPFKVGTISDVQFGKIGASSTIIYDHSDTKNWENMPKRIESGDPSDAPIVLDDSWTGIYIPQIDVQLPAAIKKFNGDPVTFAAKNLIYQEGICGQVTATNILTVGEGSLDGWFLSIDEIGLNFWKNSFKKSYLKGKLVLPPSGSEYSKTNNQIDYSCTLTKPAGEAMAFEFSANPKNDLNFSALWTTVNIDKSSKITVRVDGDGFKAEALLTGSMAFKTDIAKLPKLTLGEMTFQNMKISSRSPYFEPGQIDFHTGGNNPRAMINQDNLNEFYAQQNVKGPSDIQNLPEESNWLSASGGGSVLGFGITETKITPVVDGGQIGFRFGGSLQLVNNVNFIPKASIDFKVYGEIDPAAGQRKFWRGVKGKIEKVQLEAKAKLGPLDVEGSVYYHDIEANGVRDYGLGGRLNVLLPGAGAQFQMQALFGSRASTQSFQYFYIDALVDFGQSGIPLFPGTALYGFAGGVYYNMSQDVSGRKNSVGAEMPKDNSNTEDPTAVQITSFSGNKYTPNNSNGGQFGIIAGVYFGLSSRSTLEGLLSMEIAFNNNGGFDKFNLAGKASILSGAGGSFLERYENALAQANMLLEIKMINNLFHTFRAEFDYDMAFPRSAPLVSAKGMLEFYIENTLAINSQSKEGTLWYFRMGRPRPFQPNSISFLNGFIKSDAYFQMGNPIDPMPKIPDRILEIMGVEKKNTDEEGSFDQIEYSQVKKTRDEDAAVTGKGMIFGALTEIKANPKFLIFYASIYAGIGFDVSILQRDKPECDQPAGSWYARGQAYVGAEAACGVNINVFGIKKQIEFIRAGLGASAELGGPAPLYVRGTLGGRFAVLDGLISGRFNIRFVVGTICDDKQDSRELKLISDIYPDGGEVSTLASPTVSFNYPLNKDFIVPITSTDNDGNIKAVKYDLFRFRKEYVTISLKEGNQPVFSINDFGLAVGENAMPENKSMYYNGPIYKLALKPNLPLLKPDTEFEVNVEAKVKYFPDLTYEDDKRSATERKADQSAKKDILSESQFQYVKTGNLGFFGPVYVDKKDIVFKTDKGPKKISLENLVDIMPVHRHKTLPFGVLNDNTAYLKLNRGYDASSFGLDLNNPKTRVRIVNMGSGNAETNKIDLPIQNADPTNWTFKLPTSLLPNQNYAIRFYVKGDPINPSPEPQVAGTKLMAIDVLKMEGDALTAGGDVITSKRNIIKSGLRMGSGERDVFSWYFNTGKYRTFEDKYNGLKIRKLKVGDMEADIRKDISQNLEAFKWFNEETKSITAFKVHYEFEGPEYFNALDDGNWTLGDVFPNLGNSNTAAKLARDYKNMVYDHGRSVTDLNNILDRFVTEAFGENRTLDLKLLNIPWNAITGGIGSYTDPSFPRLSAIMPPDQFDVNYNDNNYGIPPAEGSYAEDFSTDPEKTEKNKVNTIVMAAQNATAIMSANFVNTNRNILLNSANKYVFTLDQTIHHQSGQGAVLVTNQALRVIQSKKNLGYPPDIVARAGVFMDQVKGISQPASIQIAPTIQSPKINLKMR
ncbi:hypothetical protein [Pedobacter foliorum]|uniref:hypothetical protein n=1 Tax=Pedobacter foliorum TaxID=2739058 RepID=UPI001566A9FC|nr:hypothetical protein [Pedobacter foliorum]NRF39478.1 hypothetical protein [Pedobacter foliorum]